MNSRDITEYLETHKKRVFITWHEDYKTRHMIFTGTMLHPKQGLLSGDVVVWADVKITKKMLDDIIEAFEAEYTRKMPNDKRK